jgi:catechol 2,3-dioxygenase-like lactoylglutathione lyase family enzyme
VADQPEFKLTRISIVMLGVRHLARSIEFYRDKLGLKVQSQSSEFAFLDAGGVALALALPLAQALGGSSAKLGGASELVFAVDDVQIAYEALSAKGITFLRAPHNVTGAQWAANFEDSDGHELSVFGANPKGA